MGGLKHQRRSAAMQHYVGLFATSRLHFAYAIGNMFAALRIGASNILLERWATAPSVAETVERFKPTVMLCVPAVYPAAGRRPCADAGFSCAAPLCLRR
jgi:benzoate-CoA ligase